MTLSPEWILGSLITLLALVLGFAFKQITDLNIKTDVIERDYVRRDDNDGKIERIEKGVAEVRSDLKETNAMLVRVLVALGKQV